MAKLNRMGAMCYHIEVDPSLSLGIVTGLGSPLLKLHCILVSVSQKVVFSEDKEQNNIRGKGPEILHSQDTLEVWSIKIILWKNSVTS